MRRTKSSAAKAKPPADRGASGGRSLVWVQGLLCGGFAACAPAAMLLFGLSASVFPILALWDAGHTVDAAWPSLPNPGRSRSPGRRLAGHGCLPNCSRSRRGSCLHPQRSHASAACARSAIVAPPSGGWERLRGRSSVRHKALTGNTRPECAVNAVGRSVHRRYGASAVVLIEHSSRRSHPVERAFRPTASARRP